MKIRGYDFIAKIIETKFVKGNLQVHRIKKGFK